MINLMRYKYVFFIISLLAIIPGCYFFARYGLRLSIDFTGGSLLEIQNSNIKTSADIEKVKTMFKNDKLELAAVQNSGAGTYLFRAKEIKTEEKTKIMTQIESNFGPTAELRFENVGPVIGKELTMKALQSIVLASVAIVIYIAYAFREIPKPYSPWKFGIAAVVALIHDVLVVVGVFAALGHFVGVEVDALFVTAILTVIGFSVHDTIVVFDRIRENLRRTAGKTDFTQVVNDSLVQTLARSLNTSITVLLMLFALILFGGETIRWFIVALFVGVFSGTYSSIFNAAPLLVLWEERKSK